MRGLASAAGRVRLDSLHEQAVLAIDPGEVQLAPGRAPAAAGPGEESEFWSTLWSMPTVTLSEAKAHLARLIKELEEIGEPIIITRSGDPAGVLLALDDYEGLLETLEILADDDLSAAIKAGLEDVEAGRVAGHDEVWRDLDPALRR
jgi:prevent-host-death family protein